ncbi:MAG TPA: glycosyltransferase family 4 protein [Candidatus Angelobacter sp.]|nr:glycosyltransferase family 4 protein [Candidatus Angelobacter sp.]
MRKIVVLSLRDIRNSLAGGAPLYIHEIFKRLSTRYDITLVSVGGPNLSSRETIDGMKIVRVPVPKLSRFSIPLSLISRMVGPADMLIDNGDVGFPWLSPLYSKKPIVSVVYQVATEVFRYELPRPLAEIALRVEPWIYRIYRKKTIVTCSSSTKTDLMRIGIPAENITIVRPGIDEHFLRFQPSGEKFAEPTIVCIGRFRRYKGIHYAIEAMKYILPRVPGARLIIVGSGDSTQIERQANETDFEDRIKILKRAPYQWNEEKRSLLEKAHVVLVPSVREGYGIVVIEANACGTCAVGWKVPGLQDSIIDEQTGILVPFDNVQMMANRVSGLLMNSGYRQRLACSALQWARGHSWEKAAEEFGHLIDSVGQCSA